MRYNLISAPRDAARRLLAAGLVLTTILPLAAASRAADPFAVRLTYQTESSPGSGRFHRLTRDESWRPEATAIIVCDVWDLHHCLNAVRRVEEFGPRLNAVLKQARAAGATIIHAPSDCMTAYADHPARQRAISAPAAKVLPPDIKSWCSKIPSEEQGVYPIDQSDGGEDDDPVEHAVWAAKLKSLGRNPGLPWQKQADLIEIDADRDYLSDRGDEIWNVLEARGLRNVILTGVHTNMCVLGRPFGLRQLARNGKNVALLRDMTDTMYNPRRWPYVSHFTGTDLIVAHIERYVCPTLTSDQFLGGQPFRFAGDRRPHVAIVMSEDEYRTEQSLPVFAARYLGGHFRVSLIFGDDRERNHVPGLEAIRDADVLLVSVRRRTLPPAELNLVRNFVQAGKPVVGIRTASHAFCLRNQPPPDGLAAWPEFDAQVFGGNYTNHYGNQIKATITIDPATQDEPILHGIDRQPFVAGGSLYQTSPLAAGARVLVTGAVEGQPPEPVAWTFTRADGGRSFYTSLGHVDDFQQPAFVTLLVNALHWAAGIPPRERIDFAGGGGLSSQHWSLVQVPVEQAPSGATRSSATATSPATAPTSAPTSAVWYRCVARVPAAWLGDEQLAVTLPADRSAGASWWWNGQPCAKTADGPTTTVWNIPADQIEIDDANLVVLRLGAENGTGALTVAPTLAAGERRNELRGGWQCRLGDDATWAAMPLPSRYGGSADVVHEPPEPLFVARPVTPDGAFTAGIEGPVADAQGHVYAVNFQRQGTIGRVPLGAPAELFCELPTGSIGNGLRFDLDGSLLVADYAGHNILRIDPASRAVAVFVHCPEMHQPNDLTTAPDGSLFASDPNWSAKTGQIWRIDRDGTCTRVAEDLGTTNGIEVSPDGKTLYVNESVQRRIAAFTIAADKTLRDERVVRVFPDHGFDGMRCDTAGNLYVTRYGKGTVVKLSPCGELLGEIDVLGAKPSNLCFGGRDGRTIFVTEVEHQRLVCFRVDQPGAAWSRLAAEPR